MADVTCRQALAVGIGDGREFAGPAERKVRAVRVWLVVGLLPVLVTAPDPIGRIEKAAQPGRGTGRLKP
ncbi:hypothetical protein, partial [Streptomyces sp. NPDC054838]